MTRRFDTAPAPHLPSVRGVNRVMGLVLVALAPVVVAQVWRYGTGVLVQIALAVVFSLVVEALASRLRARSTAWLPRDLSAPVTALLFALCIPPLAPWWIALVAMIAAIGVAKHAYGGLGFNLFNPAMVGFAVAVLAFPLELSRWVPPDGGAGVRATFEAIFLGIPPSPGWDAVAQATPLDAVRSLGAQGFTLQEIAGRTRYDGTFAIATAILTGGLLLLWKRVIPWQVPAAVLGATIVLTLPFWLTDADRYASPLHHLTSGGLLLAAFFIATEPVTGCTTPRGRVVFGTGIAAITLAIREWGAYPDGVAFAVLLMNAAAPWIDRHTRPRYYGETRR